MKVQPSFHLFLAVARLLGSQAMPIQQHIGKDVKLRLIQQICVCIHTYRKKGGTCKATNITYMQMIYLYIDSHKEALRSHVINIHRKLDALHIQGCPSNKQQSTYIIKIQGYNLESFCKKMSRT